MTLVELLIVLSIVGLIASLGATFISRMASEQQANRGRLMLAQSVDGALAQLQDQLQQALPNSLRVQSNPDGVWIEWVPLLDAGVARLGPDTTGATAGDPLNADNAADTSFDVVGVPLATPAVPAWIVWQNLGTPEADAYLGSNRRGGLAVAGGGTQISFTAGAALPAGSGSGRFFIVGAPLTVACRPAAGGGFELWRYGGYGWQASQPSSSAAVSSGSADLLGSGLTACQASYGSALANIGLLNLRVTVQDSGSSARMTLVHQIAVDNSP
ncbi:MAG: type II secretion system protein [Rubrivivax sp.]|nr:type II secretion system protein [Rubrivivax sp.]